MTVTPSEFAKNLTVETAFSVLAIAKGLAAGASAYVVKNLLDMSQLVGTIERLVS